MRNIDLRQQILDIRQKMLRKKSSTAKQSGFTLIEVLIVIAIIGILIGLSAVAYQAARAAGRDTKRKADLGQISGNLEIYRTDCGQYPATITFGSSLSGCGNTYMALVPSDPSSGTRIYRYSQLSVNSYELCTSLEQGSGTVTCGGSSNCGSGATCNYKVTNP